ncbi:MAG: AAA family ATPase [Psychromonas sp.]
MYQNFFSLKRKPFSISPDPNFLFLSVRHKEALTHLQHGLQSRVGFALLTGEVGTGKTTICRALIENMETDTDIVSILNPALSDIELLSTICDNLKVEYHNNELKTIFYALKTWLINNSTQHRQTLIIIDEAQHLSVSALEQLHLLTNIKNNNKKPVQVILIGQTELQDKLKQPEFRQLAQNISTRYHLLSLNQQESHLYIQHRLNIAGSHHAIFDKSALQEIFKKCTGTPRLTNILCDRSLLAAYTQDSHIVTLKMVKQASKEIHFTQQKFQSRLLTRHGRLAVLIILSLLTLWQAPQISQRLSSVAQLPILTETEPLRINTITVATEQWFDAYPQLDLTKTTYNAALASLYSVWGYQVDKKSANCTENSVHMHCYSQKMNIQQLKKLNYPSVVTLQKDSEKSLSVVIYKINDDYQLLIDGNLISVTEQWFNQYWTGEATLLWQAPFALKGVIKFTQQGEEVTWLSNQLNKLQGWPNERKSEFDLRLVEQVSAFQRQQGLVDDGIVGTQTLMPLMQLVRPHSPRLLQERK